MSSPKGAKDELKDAFKEFLGFALLLGLTFAQILFALLLIALAGWVIGYLFPSQVPGIVQILELYEDAELAVLFLVIVVTSVVRYLRRRKVNEGASEHAVENQ